MSQIFIFTAGNKVARRNLAISIERPCDPELVFASVDAATKEDLQHVLQEAGGFYAWGAEPGERNRDSWQAMRPGAAWVFCVFEAHYRYVAKLLYKVRNAQLAKRLWGINPLTSETWELVYFLSKPESLAVPLSRVPELHKKYQGFTQISRERVRHVEDKFGSVEAFVEHMKRR